MPSSHPFSYDIERIRADFPSLVSGWALFDGPGGTQTPRQVIAAIVATLEGPLANRGAVTRGEKNADSTVVGARQAIADLVNGDPRGVVFGRSATQLAYDFSRMLSASWAPGDEIIVTRLDHDSNVRPWAQAAERAGATVRWLDFDPATSQVRLADFAALLSERTKLVAVTAASNLLGTRPPVAALTALAHTAGALVYVDGVHYTAHTCVDMQALGADFFACSPYKFLGPHLGLVAAAPLLLETLKPDKLLPSANAVPERFEFGTLPYELLAGVEAAVDYLAGLDGSVPGSAPRRRRLLSSFAALEEHETLLQAQLETGLAALTGVTVHSRAVHRTPTTLITFEGRPATDAYEFLAIHKIAAPASNFYALEATRRLGLGDAGGLRVGLAPYTTAADIERLLTGLRAFGDSARATRWTDHA
ncbi:MAG: cysteine desulfurase-like protein [Gammaproteobacteria bacterium]|nr:cysteine desulfurase-like protein [Gammaproteobacteria bacterium]